MDFFFAVGSSYFWAAMAAAAMADGQHNLVDGIETDLAWRGMLWWEITSTFTPVPSVF